MTAAALSGYQTVRPVFGRSVTAKRIATMPGWKITLVVGCTCVALGLSVFWKGDASETAAGFWPPAGAAIVALRVVPMRRWGWAFAGILFPSVIALAFSLAPIVSVAWWGIGNCAGPAVAATLLGRLVNFRQRSANHALLAFFVIAVALGPMVGGAIGAIGTVVGYDLHWFEVWREWVLGDALGVLVVAPLLMQLRQTKSMQRTRLEVAALITVVMVSTGLTFANIGRNGGALLPYLILVGMIWAGMRFGARAVSATGFAIALGANIATSIGLGPFSAGHRAADIITIQVFLLIALLTSLFAASMANELADRHEVDRLLAHQANHDTLTGLPNRAFFIAHLDEALAADRDRPQSAVGVLVVDMDDFKRFNDRHGHPIGDSALRSVADVLSRNLRDGDVVARLGGDTFGVLCTGLANAETLKAIAAKLSASLSPSVKVAGTDYPVSVCVGAAMVDGDDPITANDLLRRAEVALHHAKSAPGMTISLFDHALEAHTRRRVEIAEELRHSLDRGEMSVLYQPMISIETGQLTEFEALLRWNNRRFGPVGPDEFIPVAEDDGFIGMLGDWVMTAACQQLVEWRKNPINEGLRVAVNVSARQLSDVKFPGRVRAILAETSCPANALTIEITETAVMYDSDVSDLVLEDIRELGVRLSMDDFGTGYSSMSNLRRSPLNVLKIDRSFVAGVGRVEKDTAIVASIIDLGQSFGLEVVGEGIETLDQLEHLARLGCNYGQGFFWSHAVDAATAGLMRRKSLRVPRVTLTDPADSHNVSKNCRKVETRGIEPLTSTLQR